MDNRRTELTSIAGWIKPRTGAFAIGLLGCCLIDGGVPIVIPMFMKVVLDGIVANRMHAIWSACIAMMIVIAALVCLTPCFQYLYGRTVKAILTELRARLFQHLLKLPIAYFERTHSGDSLSRMNNDLGVIEAIFAVHLRSFATLVLSAGYAAALMFYLDWRFALALIAMGLASFYINVRYAKSLRAISAAIQSGTAGLLARQTDLVASAQTGRMFNLGSIMINRFRSLNDQLTGLMIARTKKTATLNGMNYLLMWIKNSGAIIAGTILMINGQMSLGTLVSLVLLLEQVTNLFFHGGNLWGNLQSSLAGAARVNELLHSDVEPDSEPRPASNDTNNAVAEPSGQITIRNGSFGYDGKANVLDGFDFSVEAGQSVALVGQSGGGKSTILKLLLGYYQLDQGEIRIGGRSFAEMTLPELRAMIAYVPQDSYLFEGTIEENIRYGRPDASDEEVVAAARDANAHDFIMAQPEGYRTKVGERGLFLSGGQKQRIAIARALLKQAPILAMDEATSALDAESEYAVQQGMQRIKAGRTTIAVAHRLSTIKHADVLFVIDGGRVLEQGSHDDLIKRSEVYRRLYGAESEHAIR